MASAYRLLTLMLAFVVATTIIFRCETSAIAAPPSHAAYSVIAHQAECWGTAQDHRDKACELGWFIAKNLPQSQVFAPSQPDYVVGPAPTLKRRVDWIVAAVAIPLPPYLRALTPVSLYTLLRT